MANKNASKNKPLARASLDDQQSADAESTSVDSVDVSAPSTIGVRTEGQRQLIDVRGTLQEIADAVGNCTKQAVSLWRNGSRVPGEEHRRAFAEKYGIPPESWGQVPLNRQVVVRPTRPRPERQSSTNVEHIDELIEQVDEVLQDDSLMPGDRLRAIGEKRQLVSRKQALQEKAENSLARFLTSQAWQTIEGVLGSALDPYPDAMRAVGRALRGIKDSAPAND